ncbi:hypothetical protein [Brachybacterium atlanticum]|uniref:hypothetical protein n=1 Tax=Brachybacterium atlanticum TaxID=2911888 RepID=UPI0021DFB709|nr:hypothetical protein [Brachybacterium atlanticum]
MTIAKNSSEAVRKKDTGESGNGGQFGTHTRSDADIRVHTTDPVEGMRAQGRSGQIIAALCEEIDEERDGYAGALEVPAIDGRREYYLRPDGTDKIHAEYLQNQQHNNGALSQATFDLSTGKATFTYDYEETYPGIGNEGTIEADLDLDGDPAKISDALREYSVDDGAVEDQIKESFEDPHEAARDAYLRGIGVRRNHYTLQRRALDW